MPRTFATDTERTYSCILHEFGQNRGIVASKVKADGVYEIFSFSRLDGAMTRQRAKEMLTF